MALLFVGVGGIFGGILRYLLGKIIAEKLNTTFPLGTFLINLTGAFLLGILTSIDPGENMYLLFGDGFLGAYTTFSTFMYEGFNLFSNNEKKNAVFYIIGSIVLGVLGYILGFSVVKFFI